MGEGHEVKLRNEKKVLRFGFEQNLVSPSLRRGAAKTDQSRCLAGFTSPNSHVSWRRHDHPNSQSCVPWKSCSGDFTLLGSNVKAYAKSAGPLLLLLSGQGLRPLPPKFLGNSRGTQVTIIYCPSREPFRSTPPTPTSSP